MATEEEPEQEEQIIEERLFCFLSMERECGAECMAYVTFPRSAKDDLTATQRRCLLLSSVEKLARHSTIIAKLMAETHKHTKTVEQDRQREEAKGTGPFASSPFPLTPKKDTP